jgi:hypothetical protein
MLLAGKNQVGFNRSFFQNGRANFRKKIQVCQTHSPISMNILMIKEKNYDI